MTHIDTSAPIEASQPTCFCLEARALHVELEGPGIYLPIWSKTFCPRGQEPADGSRYESLPDDAFKLRIYHAIEKEQPQLLKLASEAGKLARVVFQGWPIPSRQVLEKKDLELDRRP